MTTDTPQGQLEIHVIGAAKGESIIIRLPNGTWGVIDSYAPSVTHPSTNPTLQFLRECQVKELEFLGLTHPHDDHYRGMSHLLNQFSVKYFWRFAAMSPTDLVNLLKHLNGTAQNAYEIESASDLETTLDLINQRRKRNMLSVKHMSDIKQLYPLPVALTASNRPCDVEIWCIAPSSDHVERYQNSLRACFTAKGRLKTRPPALRHNDISGGLLIRYGRTRVVLGGDVEESNWRDTLANLDHAELAAHAVKVSHHGSATGYTSNLWACFCADGGQPFAIIPPYRRHRLPKREAVEHIRQHTPRIMTTCRPAISFPTTDDFDIWETYALQVQLAIRGVFRSFRAGRADELGMCSLTFDDSGNCLSIKYDGAASPL